MFPTSESIQRKLLESLNSQRLDGKFCDVMLNIGNASFPIHSCVLASFSPGIFQNEGGKEFIGSWSFKQPWIFNLRLPRPMGNVTPQYGKDVVDCCVCTLKVIEFMYLGKIEIPKEHLKHVEALSAYLQISDLLLICKKFVCQTSDESLPNAVTKSGKDFSSNIGITNSTNWPTFNRTYNDNNEELYSFNSNIEAFVFPDQIIKVQGPLQNDPNVGISSLLQSQISCPETAYKNPHTCSKCELTFSNSAQLRQHRETHLGKLYTCYTCKYSSQKAIELMKHLLEANHNESVCSLCMYEGENPEMLKQHIEQHNHPKPFFCPICNLRFPTRTGLNFHTPKHSTKTPFHCSVCHRGFKWKHNLQSHLVVHTTEKKHLCDQCGFSTAHKSTFKAHGLSHTGHTFKCPQAECKFEAVSKRNLIVHLSTHTKEKPYQCEICGQSFSQSKNLRRHAVKHDASVEVYCCPLSPPCLFKTMRYDKLKEHFKKHHSKYDEKLLPMKKKKNNLTGVIEEPNDVLLTSKPLELKKLAVPGLADGSFELPLTILTNDANCIVLEAQVMDRKSTEVFGGS